jgi:tRNA(Glu) U13 pseudouridine synthase TruD
MKMSKMQRNIYLHAYQSLLWNEAVSRRIEQFGLDAHERDYVLKDGEYKLRGDSNDKEDSFIPILGTETKLDSTSIVYNIY